MQEARLGIPDRGLNSRRRDGSSLPAVKSKTITLFCQAGFAMLDLHELYRRNAAECYIETI